MKVCLICLKMFVNFQINRTKTFSFFANKLLFLPFSIFFSGFPYVDSMEIHINRVFFGAPIDLKFCQYVQQAIVNDIREAICEKRKKSPFLSHFSSFLPISRQFSKIFYPHVKKIFLLKCAEKYFRHTTQNSEAFKKPFFCYKKFRWERGPLRHEINAA